MHLRLSAALLAAGTRCSHSDTALLFGWWLLADTREINSMVNSTSIRPKSEVMLCAMGKIPADQDTCRAQ